ncbi:MAG: zinc ribbon domain-containing protein [Thermodesulfobacteriota bacterium]
MIRPPISSPSCQSCGVNLKKPTEFGTTATRCIDTNFCRFCYWKGEFTEPDITMEQMIEKVAKSLVKTKRVSPEKALEMAKELIPTLKRWQVEA